MPSISLGLCKLCAEATLYGWRHGPHVLLIDAPVQPRHLYPFISAFLDNFEGRVDGCDASDVVSAGGVDEVVLHVDHDQDCLRWINDDSLQLIVSRVLSPGSGSTKLVQSTWKHHYPMRENAMVCVDHKFLRGSARKVETLCVRDVVPRVVAMTERDGCRLKAGERLLFLRDLFL